MIFANGRLFFVGNRLTIEERGADRYRNQKVPINRRDEEKSKSAS